VLRPLLAMRWIEQGLGMPPIELDALLARTLRENTLREAIEALLVEKRAGTELGDGPRIPEIRTSSQPSSHASSTSPARSFQTMHRPPPWTSAFARPSRRRGRAEPPSRVWG
jgi:predicted nucleotidyltransferase